MAKNGGTGKIPKGKTNVKAGAKKAGGQTYPKGMETPPTGKGAPGAYPFNKKGKK